MLSEIYKVSQKKKNSSKKRFSKTCDKGSKKKKKKKRIKKSLKVGGAQYRTLDTDVSDTNHENSLNKSTQEQSPQNTPNITCQELLNEDKPIPDLNMSKIGNISGHGDIWKSNIKCGSGASKNVYAGYLEEREQKKLVAIHELNYDNLSENSKQRIENEIEIYKKNTHPNLMTIIGSFQANTHKYYISELGETLDYQSFLENHSLIDLIKDVLSGLNYLEENHITHRDIKLGNIVKVGDFFKIIDFGVSTKYIESEPIDLKPPLDKRTSVINEQFLSQKGTKTYIPPERWNNPNDVLKSDVYALGITIMNILFQKSLEDVDIFKENNIYQDYMTQGISDEMKKKIVLDNEFSKFVPESTGHALEPTESATHEVPNDVVQVDKEYKSLRGQIEKKIQEKITGIELDLIGLIEDCLTFYENRLKSSQIIDKYFPETDLKIRKI